ncbi:MAG: hypothetical protein KJ069_05990 [Anaerolineae bacterium]|nr:hypothetical protein [Anaerolineae bacterium]
MVAVAVIPTVSHVFASHQPVFPTIAQLLAGPHLLAHIPLCGNVLIEGERLGVTAVHPFIVSPQLFPFALQKQKTPPLYPEWRFAY